MQMNVVREEPVAGSMRLFEAHKQSHQPGQKILRGVHHSPETLAQQAVQQANEGATVIYIDECSEKQLQHLQRLEHDWPAELRILAVVRCVDFQH